MARQNTTFDPSAHTKPDSGGNAKREEPPAGEHLVALVWFERRQAKSGADYLRAKFQVIVGPHEGKAFFTNLSLDLSKDAATTRLSLWCKATGYDGGAFDVSKNANIKRVFGFKPFKIRLRVEEKDGNNPGVVLTNYEIERYILKLQPGDKVAIDDWIMAQAEKRALGGSGGESGSGPSSTSGSDFGDDAPPPGDDDNLDDDIPF